MRCANLTTAILRARSRFDVDDDGDVDADDFNARFRMIVDLNITAADCTTLELSEVECEQLRNFTARVHSRFDVDNDGDVDGADANLRFRLIADLNITAADCMRLELTEEACTRLSNITSRARSRLDVENDGDVDARDVALRFRIVGDLNVTAADCKALELTDKECDRLQNFTSRVHSRLDVNNDGDVDGNDLQARLGAFADLNLTAADCARLELSDAECTSLGNLTLRVRSRLDVDNDGDVDAEDLALRFGAFADRTMH